MKIEVELQETMGSDISIANAAWSSTYDKNKREDKYDDEDKVKKLVEGMVTAGHSTPFESVVFRFWFRWPIFVDRQHMTHRIASHNGLSGRYRTLPEDWYSVPVDVQNIFDKINHKLGKHTKGCFDALMREQQEFYRAKLYELKSAEHARVISNKEYKRAREVIRGVIGTATMVERTTMMNLRSFANYQKLRNSEHAQKEIHDAADMMLQQVIKSNVCPVALSALQKHGWNI